MNPRSVAVRAESLVAVFIAGYAVVLGGLAGVVWQRLASTIRLVAAANGSVAATKALLDDDMQFAVIAVVGGVVTVLLLVAASGAAGTGPGAVVGLAVGGVLAALVAAHLGAHVRAPTYAVSALRQQFPGNTAHALSLAHSYFGFRLRTHSLLVIWPVVSLAAHLVWVGARTDRPGARG